MNIGEGSEVRIRQVEQPISGPRRRLNRLNSGDPTAFPPAKNKNRTSDGAVFQVPGNFIS